MKTRRYLSFTLIPLLAITAFTFLGNLNSKTEVSLAAISLPNSGKGYTNHDAAIYYNGIDDSLTGDDLLAQLRSLNKNKYHKLLDYSSMGTTPAPVFQYTDYNPKNVKYDSNNQPYNTTVQGFYSGTITASFNKEHVWPNSHGGNVVEDDLHMPRPTLKNENGSRGNSFYVTGMKSTEKGWDPGEESFGDVTYRGEAARIVFYCLVANSTLSLMTSNTNPDKVSGKKDYKMGNLNDLLKWHIWHGITDREERRNEGVEYLQGNRNPFVDHPEYVCRIWGKRDDLDPEVKALCENDPYEDRSAPTSFTAVISSTTLEVGDSADLSITNLVPSDANGLVKWTSLDTSIATVGGNKVTAIKEGDVTLKATSALDESVYSTVDVTVIPSSKVILSDINVSIDNNQLEINQTTNVRFSTVPENVNPEAIFVLSSKNTDVATVNRNGLVTAKGSGTTEIVIRATQGEVVKTKELSITVKTKEINKTLSSISITDAQTEYDINDDFVAPTVIANYDDGSSKIVSELAVFSGFQMDKVGRQRIAVSYTENGVTANSSYYITISGDNNKQGCAGNINKASISVSVIALTSAVSMVIISSLRRKKRNEK